MRRVLLVLVLVVLVMSVLYGEGTPGLEFNDCHLFFYGVSIGTATCLDIVVPRYGPEGIVRSIAIEGFAGSDITSITMPSFAGLFTAIGHHAFSRCTGLTSITIPSSVQLIGIHAFAYTNLTSVHLPRSAWFIDRNPFMGCSELKEITIDENVVRYRVEGNSLIRNSNNALISGFQNSVIPESVTIIAYYAFGNQSNLTYINIPNSVTSFEWGAFEGCTALTTITIPESVTHIGNMAFARSGLISIDIPNSVTSVGLSVLADCKNLENVTLSSNL